MRTFSFGAVVIVGLLGMSVSRSHAPYFCMPSVDSAAYTTPNGMGVKASAASSLTLFCPLIDDSGEVDRGSSAIIQLQVGVNDQSAVAEVTAVPCVQFFGVVGSQCSSST